MENHANEKAAPSQKNAWLSFIKSIATSTSDLSTLTAPPFLLSPQSILEFSTYWCEHPSLFTAAAHEKCPETRALLVLKWFLSTLKHQHSSRDAVTGKKKKMKPLNPFLGEVFAGEWRDEGTGTGITKLVAEQVEHHPPITAFKVWNEKAGISLHGNVAPKIYFSSTVHIDRKGYSILHIDAFDEDYVITMPKIHVEGLMSASLMPELSGCSYIRSSSGCVARIEYGYRGWLGGKRNSFKASIVKDGLEGRKGEVLYELEGVWSGEYTVRDVRKRNKVLEKVDLGALERATFCVKPIGEQEEMESRRAWRFVAEAIEEGDMLRVGREKGKIENEQRELRRLEKLEGVGFERRYFSQGARGDGVAERLIDGLEGVGVRKGDLEGGVGGVWMWDQEKFEEVERERRAGLKSPRGLSFDSGIGMGNNELALTKKD